MPMSFTRHPSSYRDPSGFVFWKDGVLYRQVNVCFKKDFEFFIDSGLYSQLVEEKHLLPFEIVGENITGTDDWHATIKPSFINFISYPYEWSFDMLKDAAILSLTLAKMAMQKGMMLKDATPFNIQFVAGRPVFIDTLSFEILDATKPWIAYRQFCECFLAPLALMHYLKMPLQPLMLSYPEGIPLVVAQKMLPAKSKFNLSVYLHLHLHAGYSKAQGSTNKRAVHFSQKKFLNILESLEKTVASFHLDHKAVWSGYYDEAQQRPEYLEQKKSIIAQWLKMLPAIKTAIDVGANEGVFSELLAAKNISTVSADSDHFSVNALYNKIRKNSEKLIHPLLIDLANPSPAIGVNNEERISFIDRTKKDLVMALAVIHHLCIGKNIPFESVASFMHQLGTFLIIEFVPREDEKIMLMLQQKKDIYEWYNEENFQKSFTTYFRILSHQQLKGSNRIMYLMQQK